jgi:diguanylate cyclase (GGDEF)-like protein
VGDAAQLYAESAVALRELEKLGLVTQNPASARDRLVFQVHNGDRIHLQDPGALQQASRPASRSSTTVSDPAGEAQARPFPPAPGSLDGQPVDSVTRPPAPGPASDHVSQPERYEEDTPTTSGDSSVSADVPTQLVDSLQPFLELAGLESELTSLSGHLQHVLERIESQWSGARVRLLCLAEEVRETLSGPNIHTVSRQDVDSVPHHAEALRKGDVSLATAARADVGVQDAPVAAAVPVRVHGRDWGLLEVTWPSISARSMQQQVLLLRSVASLIELAIQNQNTMENLVFIDPLTGVYNRGFYERQVALEVERSHRTERKFGLLVLDVDDFKRINDAYGHRAGDTVLAAVAHELSSKMRKIDLLFRYGGEEFVVLLPGAEQEETERTGERLRRIVDEMRFTSDAVPADLRVTISVGAAVFPDHSRTQSGIFKAADEAMYRAKRQGKNRVALCSV